MQKRTVWVFLVICLLVGALFRFPGLGTNSFVADEFLDINSTYGYHQTGEWRAWDFNYGAPSQVNENSARDERAFVYKWQVAALFSVLPPTEATARSVSVLWGLISILVVAWSAWIFTRRADMSLVAALLAAISISAIIYSRRLRMYAMFFPLYLGAATAWYAFYEAEYRGQLALVKRVYERYQVHLGYLGLALALSALAFLTHGLTVHLVIVLGVYVALRSWETRTMSWQRNPYLLTLGAGFVGGALLLITHLELLRSVPNRLEDHFGYIAHLFRDFASVPIGIAVTAYGLAAWYRRDQTARRASLYLGISILVPLLLAIFLWLRNVGAQYIYFIQSFVMIAAAIGLVSLYEALRARFAWEGRRTLLLGAFVLLALVPNWGYFLEENNTYHETSSGDNPNYRKVFAFVKKELKPGDVLVTRNFRNYYWSGAAVPVIDFGGELSKVKFSLTELQAVEANAAGRVWFVASDNDLDYVAKDVDTYLRDRYERVSNDQVRGSISVYRSLKP